ncbi:prolyl endopeptidase FAP-like [Ciona intestinalis]
MKTLHIALLVVGGIAVVCAIVIPCAILIPQNNTKAPAPVTTTPGKPGAEVTTAGATTPAPPDTRPVFTFDDIYNNKYSYKSIYPSWDESTPAQNDFLYFDGGNVTRRVIENPYDDVEQVAPDTLCVKYGGCRSWSVSADAKFVFYIYNYTKVWRHSYLADFAIWDVVKAVEVEVPGFPKDAQIHYMKWSPTGHKLVYVHQFNVKLIEDVGAATPTIVDVSPTDGMKNIKYYGIPDWMYEEEMVSTNNVLYWNTDSTKIAFLETDTSNVGLIKYTWYGDAQYPETIEIAYPKAGTTISSVKMWVYDITTAKLDQLDAPAEFSPPGTYYFSRFTWQDPSNCLVSWTNRLQTKSIGNLCVMSGTDTSYSCSSTTANMEEVIGGWVGSFGPFYPKWITGSNDYVTIYARANDGDATDGYWQLAYVAEGVTNFEWITKTSYDITEVTYYDATNKYVYYTAAYNEARRRHIFRVLATARDQTAPECMTCKFMDTYPDRCGWVTPSFNIDGSAVVINCRGYWIPMTLYITIDATGTWENEVLLENNTDLFTKVEAIKWPRKIYGKFPSPAYPSKPYNYEMWVPADFDETKKYPVLLEVYAGPEFQKIQDVWRKGFAQTYMVSTRDVIVVSVDGRGSAFEGYNFMRQVYLKLGQYEPIDQTAFVRYLIDTFDYVDASHVALWGWSYGGYTTSHTIGYDGGKTFQCGLAVAPLGDWTWYDAMYAERYMGELTTNVIGYEKASIVRGHDLNNFKNASYTLIHGTADDNVHFQSAAEMEKALVEHDVDFDDFFYADQAHSINVGNANKHIYRQIDLRLSHCLGRVDTQYPSG